MSGMHNLYIASEGPEGPVKIGHSSNAWARLSALRTGNCRPLKMAFVYRLAKEDALEAEQALHEELEMHALEGEWFDLSENFMATYMPDFFLAHGFEVAE